MYHRLGVSIGVLWKDEQDRVQSNVVVMLHQKLIQQQYSLVVLGLSQIGYLLKVSATILDFPGWCSILKLNA